MGDAGALGSLGVGATKVEAAAAMIAEVRARTSAPFNVNLFVHQPATAGPSLERAWIDRLRPQFEALGAPPALTEIYRS